MAGRQALARPSENHRMLNAASAAWSELSAIGHRGRNGHAEQRIISGHLRAVIIMWFNTIQRREATRGMVKIVCPPAQAASSLQTVSGVARARQCLAASLTPCRIRQAIAGGFPISAARKLARQTARNPMIRLATESSGDPPGHGGEVVASQPTVPRLIVRLQFHCWSGGRSAFCEVPAFPGSHAMTWIVQGHRVVSFAGKVVSRRFRIIGSKQKAKVKACLCSLTSSFPAALTPLIRRTQIFSLKHATGGLQPGPLPKGQNISMPHPTTIQYKDSSTELFRITRNSSSNARSRNVPTKDCSPALERRIQLRSPHRETQGPATCVRAGKMF